MMSGWYIEGGEGKEEHIRNVEYSREKKLSNFLRCELNLKVNVP